MQAVEDKGSVYAFGSFVLDPGERTLFSNGTPLHLPAKEFETLVLLVENNGKVLSKDAMMAAVWNDAFVEEGNLAKQISRLRKLLEVDGNKYIETVPKHGYRFKADVSRVLPSSPTLDDSGAEVTLNDANPPVQVRGFRPLTSLSVVFLVLLAGAVGVVFYYLIVNRPPTGANVSAARSVAVLPFKPVAGNEPDENLRLGLTDALITKLSGLKDVVVRPTNAVRKYMDQEPVSAGRELGVDTVLDGNIQLLDQQIRVTVQLINVENGSLIWGGKFDERFTDIFSLQDAISQAVATAIRPGLSGTEKSFLTKRYTKSAEAQQAYVQGRLLWNRRTADTIRSSIALFDDAIRKDPTYALAFAGRADAYSLLADYNGAPQKESYEKARESALKALELDPDLAEAHTALAYTKMYYFWDWEGSDREYRRAIEINPNYATAHQWYSEYLAGMGRFDEALAEIRRAKEIDPLSPVINAGEVWILYFARRYDDAIEHGRRLVESNPEFAEVNEYLKRSYDQKGMYSEAINMRQMRRKLVGLDFKETSALRKAAAATDHDGYWKARLEQELEEAKTEGPATYDLAEIYAQLGDKDRAFEWLEKAFEQRTYFMMYIKVAPNLDPVRSDPRFTEMLRRIGRSN